MSKQNDFHFKVSILSWILFFSFANGSFAKGNSYTDTTKKTLLASLDKKEKTGYVTLEANVVFPEILSGNEEESLDYIEKFSVNRRAYVIRTYNRGKNYFPKVSTIFEKYDLPNELKVLLALESAFNANAVSKAGAVGYWQIMDEVAREYGLKYASHKKVAVKNKQGKKVYVRARSGKDDRKNFNKSTYAAARYLKDRSRNLNNDILLMVASYNCGVGNVWEAMEKSGKDNPDFWDIKNYLPAETRTYVMNFITLNVLFYNYEKFSNNTLNFKPINIKLDNLEHSMTDDSGDLETTSSNK